MAPSQTFLLGVMRVKELSILLVTIAVGVYFTSTSDAFNTVANYQTIAQYVAPWAIVAAGQVMLLICGEIDLSAGFVFALAPFTLMQFHVNGWPLGLALAGAIVVSTLIGVTNGLIRTVLGIPSFITTLGMAFLLNGLVLIISNGRPVGAPQDPAVMQVFGAARWSEMLWAIGVVIVMQVVLSATRFGIHTQATGGNPIGAAESGIAVNRIKVVNFAIIGTLAGLAGILQGTRVGSYDPTNGGFDTMFMAVASAIIGGTALIGGTGTVVGAFLGALLLGIAFDGFNVLGVSANAFNVVLGAAILIAMVLNVTLLVVRKRMGSRGLA